MPKTIRNCYYRKLTFDNLYNAYIRASLNKRNNHITQTERQRAFETFKTTDDHCMEIVGIAHDSEGTKYFICKNSWGTSNPYGGLLYMSFEYARLNTIAVVMKKQIQ